MKNIIRKTFITLAIVIICSVIIAQNIVNPSKQWNIVIHCLPSFTIMTEAIKFEGDTIIEDVEYMKIRRSTDEHQEIWENYGFIRETSENKVYYRNDTSEQEYLLYDFDVNVDDTVNLVSLNGNDENYYLTTKAYLISLIDTIFFAGQDRKRIHLNYIDTIDNTNSSIDYIIEGIGSSCGILHINIQYLCHNSFELLCYYEDNNLIYHNSSYESCYHTYTNIEPYNYSELSITVYPNPVNNELIISCKNDINYIEIYDILGQLILKKSDNISNTIDVSGLNNGMYIIYLRSKNNYYQSKFIVSRNY